MPVELNVNGQMRTVAVEPRTSLLDCLREELLLTGEIISADKALSIGLAIAQRALLVRKVDQSDA